MHPKNRHQRYDFPQLIKVLPELASFIEKSKRGEDTVDFANPEAVKALNHALLKAYYGVIYWDIPQGFLCPPIPGRVDYIHHVAELLNGKPARILDVGVGANCIYPLLGVAEYGWDFVGSEIHQDALSSAKKIIKENQLEKKVELRLQTGSGIFKGIISPSEKFDLTICNPPFHESAEAAQEGTQRKWKNLGKKITGLNFGGKSNELWTKGGERSFIQQMIKESLDFKHQVEWFTCLVSKEANLSIFKQRLQEAEAKEIKVIEMSQGQKISRVLAWSFR